MVKYRIDGASGWGKGPVSEDKCIVQRKCGEFLGEGQVEIHPLRVWFRLRDRGGHLGEGLESPVAERVYGT